MFVRSTILIAHFSEVTRDLSHILSRKKIVTVTARFSGTDTIDFSYVRVSSVTYPVFVLVPTTTKIELIYDFYCLFIFVFIYVYIFIKITLSCMNERLLC